MTSVLVSTEDPEFYDMLEYILRAEGFRARLVGLHDICPDERGEPAIVLLEASANTIQHCRAVTHHCNKHEMMVIALVQPGYVRLHTELLRAGATLCLSRPFSLSQLLDVLHKLVGFRTGQQQALVDRLRLDPSRGP